MGKTVATTSGDIHTDASVKKVKKPAVSKSTKAGLIFPIPKINKKCVDKRLAARVGAGAPVYIAGVVEYIAREILDLAAEKCKERKHKRIMPEDVVKGIRGDKDMHKMLAGLSVLIGEKLDQSTVNGAITCDHDVELKAKKKVEDAKKKANAA